MITIESPERMPEIQVSHARGPGRGWRRVEIEQWWGGRSHTIWVDKFQARKLIDELQKIAMRRIT